MSIQSQCMECEATSLNGVLKHTKACTAYQHPPTTLESNMPATKLTFSSQAEADEWLKNLQKSAIGEGQEQG